MATICNRERKDIVFYNFYSKLYKIITEQLKIVVVHLNY